MHATQLMHDRSPETRRPPPEPFPRKWFLENWPPLAGARRATVTLDTLLASMAASGRCRPVQSWCPMWGDVVKGGRGRGVAGPASDSVIVFLANPIGGHGYPAVPASPASCVPRYLRTPRAHEAITTTRHQGRLARPWHARSLCIPASVGAQSRWRRLLASWRSLSRR